MAIQILKLVTGENVLGEVTPTPEGRMKVTEPVTIRMYPSQIAGGQPTLGFAPWPDFADLSKQNVVFVEPLHVAYSYVPSPELISEYNGMISNLSKTTSGIITG
jgi:hypothetical protein